MPDEQEATHLTTAERLEKAEARERKTREYRERLQRVATAEAEVPGAWATGEATKEGLARTYGVSVNTIQRILDANGVVTTRVHRLTDPERAEIATMLRQGTSSLEIQAAYGISHNTVRNIGLKAGVLRPGERKPQRTDEEYARIQELDELARQRFGAGIYNLGVGLRTWERKQKLAAEGAPVADDGHGGELASALQESVTPEPAPVPMGPPPSPPLLPTEEWHEPDPGNANQEAPVSPPSQLEPAPQEAPAQTEGDFKF